jgi:RNA polymerase sigma factor (sigma-70 family)
VPGQRQFGQDGDRPLVEESDLETFMTASLPALYRVARSLCRNRESAEDLVADTIAAVVARWHTITTSPAAYTRRTMINLFLNDVRHHNVIQEVATDEVPQPPDTWLDQADAAAARIDLERALAKLRPELRVVIVLRFLLDLPVAEVALIVHRPAGTVRRLTHDAITSLRNDGLLQGVRSEK